MRKILLAAIMAASALVPAAAFAQDDHHDRGGHQQHQNGGGGQPHQQPARQAPPRQAPQPQAQPRFEHPQGGDGPTLQHFDRGQGQVQQQQRGNWQGGRPSGWAGGSQQQPQQQVIAPRAPQQSQQGWRQGGRDGRPDQRADGRQQGARGDWRGNDGRQRTDNRGGGNWNRNWRNDNRYNWSNARRYNRENFHLPRYYAPYGWDYGYRRFSIGLTLDSILFEQNYWIDDPSYYDLPPAYGPYRWVRYYNDALLVDIYTGQVVDTVYDIFW